MIVEFFYIYFTCTREKMAFNFKCQKSSYSCILLGKHVFYTLYNVHIYKYIYIYVYIQRDSEERASNIGDCVKIFKQLWFIMLIIEKCF